MFEAVERADTSESPSEAAEATERALSKLPRESLCARPRAAESPRWLPLPALLPLPLCDCDDEPDEPTREFGCEARKRKASGSRN